MLISNKMDGLEISRTVETGRAQTQAAEQQRFDRQQRVQDILDKRDQDLKNASDKKDSDYDTDWTQGAITGGETAFRFVGGRQTPMGITALRAIKGGVNDLVGAVGAKISGDPSAQPLPSRNIVEGPSDAEAEAVQKRAVRVAAAGGSLRGGRQILPAQVDAPLGTQVAEGNRMRALGQQRNVDITGGAQRATQDEAMAIARRNAPTETKTWKAGSGLIATDVVASNPAELQETKPARNAVITEQIANKETATGQLTTKLGKVQDLLNHPVSKVAGKVYGNIQGGEDIYDFFKHKDQFDPKGPGGEAMYASHILDSLGTVSDLIGTFVPGAEELGAVLNVGADVAKDVGQYQKDSGNASGISASATAAVSAVNAAPQIITPALQTAGLVASASRHIQNQSSVGAF
tara:strand:- start:499 stop:1713 length:1215 start_codon:yes stop_codon:yes gene_type:complete